MYSRNSNNFKEFGFTVKRNNKAFQKVSIRKLYFSNQHRVRALVRALVRDLVRDLVRARVQALARALVRDLFRALV